MTMKLITTKEAARMLSMSHRTLENMRGSGKGPAYIKLGYMVRYDQFEVERWAKSNLVDR